MISRTDDYATVFVATCDLVGQVRGRAVPPSEHAALLRSGTGWVPANLAISSFGPIAPDNVFGSRGDLRLIPDADSAVGIPADGGAPGMLLYLADQKLPDGQPWGCCPRTVLRDALADLRERTGLEVVAAFEHEFVLEGLPERSVLAAALPGRRTVRHRSGAAAGAHAASNRRPGFPSTARVSSRSPCAPPPPWSRPTGPSSSRNSSATWPAAVNCPSPSPLSSTPTEWATASMST